PRTPIVDPYDHPKTIFTPYSIASVDAVGDGSLLYWNETPPEWKGFEINNGFTLAFKDIPIEPFSPTNAPNEYVQFQTDLVGVKSPQVYDDYGRLGLGAGFRWSTDAIGIAMNLAYLKNIDDSTLSDVASGGVFGVQYDNAPQSPVMAPISDKT